MVQPIVITGFMGSGKSRVAREIARRLDVTMIDLDGRSRSARPTIRSARESR